jgi:hypothetical protein
MAKFRVLAPVEHDQTLYMPKDDVTAGGKVKSAGNGQEILVDSSGVIELDEAQAKALGNGQVEPISAPAEASPDSKRTRR